MKINFSMAKNRPTCIETEIFACPNCDATFQMMMDLKGTPYLEKTTEQYEKFSDIGIKLAEKTKNLTFLYKAMEKINSTFDEPFHESDVEAISACALLYVLHPSCFEDPNLTTELVCPT